MDSVHLTLIALPIYPVHLVNVLTPVVSGLHAEKTLSALSFFTNLGVNVLNAMLVVLM